MACRGAADPEWAARTGFGLGGTELPCTVLSITPGELIIFHHSLFADSARGFCAPGFVSSTYTCARAGLGQVAPAGHFHSTPSMGTLRSATNGALGLPSDLTNGT